MKIIGRETEIKELKRITQSNRPEFIAVYGRRRIGKTFLIKTFFNNQFDFYITGTANIPLRQQLKNFHRSLQKYGKNTDVSPEPGDWFEAFHLLEKLLEKSNNKQKLVVFFDELPWLDSPRSNFVQALEYFWNSYASSKNIALIVCGSAASWMIHKLIRNRGGLHNRLTSKLKLEPFNLYETESFLSAKGAAYSQYQIVQLYMCLGGIPFYLDAIDTGLSAVQNIHQLCFKIDGRLTGEFEELYHSLFKKPEKYLSIVYALGQKKKGLTWTELLNITKLPNAGSTTRMLTELIESGFIREAMPFGNKKRHRLFQLIDLFSLFYLNCMSNTNQTASTDWLLALDSPAQRAWSGYSFEMVCALHTNQIKKALEISGVQATISSWSGRTEDRGCQIDLIIDRRDQVINVCEVKFSTAPYEITKKYGEELLAKIQIFREVTKTKKSISLTFISTFGLKAGQFKSSFVQNDLTLNNLFLPA